MSRVALSKVRSLTLHRGEYTASRRRPPVPQLKCVGSACKLYQPEVVRCYNSGGEGTDIDWTCEADLPEKLRFGRVQVSCEGWDRPGDPYVLKGSCGLEYRLVNIGGEPGRFFSGSFWDDVIRLGFLCLAVSAALYVLYLLLRPCMGRLATWANSSPGGPPRPSSNRPSDPDSRRRPHDYPPPPPPYSANPKPGPSTSSGPRSAGVSGAVQPGFWSGLGLGGLGGLAAARVFGANRDQYRPAQEYDWERERVARGGAGLFGSFPSFTSSAWRSGASSGAGWRRPTRDDDRGEGPSNLGPMRRSTGYGVTNVR